MLALIINLTDVSHHPFHVLVLFIFPLSFAINFVVTTHSLLALGGVSPRKTHF